MRLIKAKFNSKCAETGQFIPNGNNCWYDPIKKKVYSLESDAGHGVYNEPEPEEKYYSGHAAYLERDSDYGRDY